VAGHGLTDRYLQITWCEVAVEEASSVRPQTCCHSGSSDRLPRSSGMFYWVVWRILTPSRRAEPQPDRATVLVRALTSAQCLSLMRRLYYSIYRSMGAEASALAFGVRPRTGDRFWLHPSENCFMDMINLCRKPHCTVYRAQSTHRRSGSPPGVLRH
jgi:hypothetical protein